MRQNHAFIWAAVAIVAVVVIVQVSPVRLWGGSPPAYVPTPALTRAARTVGTSTTLTLTAATGSRPVASSTKVANASTSSSPVAFALRATANQGKKATTTAANEQPASYVTLVTPQGHVSVPLDKGVRKSVLDVMRLASSLGFIFSGKEYPGMGFFVESIGGKSNANQYYWILYVNGIDSAVGASSARVTAGDTVEWKYEKGYTTH